MKYYRTNEAAKLAECTPNRFREVARQMGFKSRHLKGLKFERWSDIEVIKTVRAFELLRTKNKIDLVKTIINTEYYGIINFNGFYPGWHVDIAGNSYLTTGLPDPNTQDVKENN